MQWLSTGRHFVPQGKLGNIWGHFLSQLRAGFVTLFSGWRQECRTSHPTQDAPTAMTYLLRFQLNEIWGWQAPPESRSEGPAFRKKHRGARRRGRSWGEDRKDLRPRYRSRGQEKGERNSQQCRKDLAGTRSVFH